MKITSKSIITKAFQYHNPKLGSNYITLHIAIYIIFGTKKTKDGCNLFMAAVSVFTLDFTVLLFDGILFQDNIEGRSENKYYQCACNALHLFQNTKGPTTIPKTKIYPNSTLK